MLEFAHTETITAVKHVIFIPGNLLKMSLINIFG